MLPTLSRSLLITGLTGFVLVQPLLVNAQENGARPVTEGGLPAATPIAEANPSLLPPPGVEAAPSDSPRSEAASAGLPVTPNLEATSGDRLPDDPLLIPLEVGKSNSDDPHALAGDPALLILEAAQIADLTERSITLRLAGVWINHNDLIEAHHALTAAATSVLQITNLASRDHQLIETIGLLINLAEADVRKGRKGNRPTDNDLAATGAKQIDTELLIRSAALEWERVAFLASRVSDPTRRNEVLFRLVDNESVGACAIATDYPIHPATRDNDKSAEPLTAATDRILRRASEHAEAIQWSIWRDRALVECSVNAARALRFEVSLEIARRIKRPEVRSDALIRIAELQVRKGKDPANAKALYDEAAHTVASIPLADPERFWPEP